MKTASSVKPGDVVVNYWWQTHLYLPHSLQNVGSLKRRKWLSVTGITGWIPQYPCYSGSCFFRHPFLPSYFHDNQWPTHFWAMGVKTDRQNLKHTGCFCLFPYITIFFPLPTCWRDINSWVKDGFFSHPMFLNILAFELFFFNFIHTHMHIIVLWIPITDG